MQIGFPYRFDSRGRTAQATDPAHISQLIEQVLFVRPGERLNRPDYGSAIHQLVFDPAGGELATATQFLVQGALQRWLGDIIRLQSLDVAAVDGQLTITLSYTPVGAGAPQAVQTVQFVTDSGV